MVACRSSESFETTENPSAWMSLRVPLLACPAVCDYDDERHSSQADCSAPAPFEMRDSFVIRIQGFVIPSQSPHPPCGHLLPTGAKEVIAAPVGPASSVRICVHLWLNSPPLSSHFFRVFPVFVLLCVTPRTPRLKIPTAPATRYSGRPRPLPSVSICVHLWLNSPHFFRVLPWLYFPYLSYSA